MTEAPHPSNVAGATSHPDPVANRSVVEHAKRFLAATGRVSPEHSFRVIAETAEQHNVAIPALSRAVLVQADEDAAPSGADPAARRAAAALMARVRRAEAPRRARDLGPGTDPPAPTYGRSRLAGDEAHSDATSTREPDAGRAPA